MSNEPAEIVEQKRTRPPLLEKIETRAANIAAACSDTIEYETIMSSLEKAIAADTQILNCTPASVVGAMIASAKLGIDPSGEHNSGWFIRYGKELKLMIGYNGYIDLITRSGVYTHIVAEVVYDGEIYEAHAGTRGEIVHEINPKIRNEAGEHLIVGAYAVAFSPAGAHQFVTVSKRDIEASRSASKSKTGPWKQRYAEMVKKTAVRSLAKWMVLDRIGQEATAISDDGDGFDYRRPVRNDAQSRESFAGSIKELAGEPEQTEPQEPDGFVDEIAAEMDKVVPNG